MILPLMVTLLVNGHFLSIYFPSIASFGVLNPKQIFFQYLTPLELLLDISFLVLKVTPSYF